MKLTLSDIQHHLSEEFSGPLLFQPLDSGTPREAAPIRPVAQLATIAQLVPVSSRAEDIGFSLLPAEKQA